MSATCLKSRVRGTRRAWMLCSAAAVLVSAPAFAQATAPDDQAEPNDAEIVVTGTSIKGTAPVGTTVQVLDSSALKATGLSSTTDVLKSIPQVINLGFEEGRGGGVQGAQGNVTQARTVNLRGLGVESTLVLINGRRIAPAGTLGAGYDVSVLASNAVARVEVVADGASAIYGSDAVGGVINFITKRGRDGIETNLRYGFADGFDEKRLSQTLGYSWDTGDVFVAYQHTERGGLMGFERPQVTQDLRAFGGPDTRGTFGSPGTIVVSGVTYAIPTGTNGVGITRSQLVAGTANREDINLTRSLLVDQNSDVVFGSVHQNVTPNIELWAEGQFSDRVYDGFGTSLNRGTAFATLTVPRSNPFFVHPTSTTATTVSVNYSFSGMAPFRSHGGERAWGFASGVKWSPGSNWTVEAAFNRSGNNAFRRADQIWTFNLAAALADTNPATALNPFCDPNAFSTCFNPATVEKLMGYNIIAGRYRSTDWTAKANGPLFHIGGGDVSIAVGGQYTRSNLLSTITTLTTTATPNARPIYTHRSVKAGYAELLVPLFGPENATTGFEKLNLSAAVRVEEFSDFGTTTNPKFGISWMPVDGMTFRGSYGTSYRAPTLANIDYRTSATYATGTIFDSSLGRNIRYLSLLGFKDGIGPEKATTYTFGIDLAPPPMRGFKASISYFNIDYKDRIASVASSTILANPSTYAAFITRSPSSDLVLSYMNTPYFTSVPENPANIEAIVDGRTLNIGGLKESGIDASASYSFEAGSSRFNMGFSLTKLLKAELSPALGLPFGDVLDLINNPVSLRGRANLGWQSGGARIDAFINHVGGYTNNLRNPAEHVNAWTTLDLTASYELPESSPSLLRGLSLSVSLINATNAGPPFVINTTAASEGFYDSQNASVVGRFIAFEITKKW